MPSVYLRKMNMIKVKRRDYLHNTVSFYRTYEKEVAPEIDNIMKNIDVFLKYKDDINHK